MSRPEPWTHEQNAVTVQGYLGMLSAELRGEKFVKKAVYEDIAQEIGKGPKSVEFKFANISAVLQELDLPWVTGLAPRVNFQATLVDEVVEQFSNSPLEEQVRRFMLDAPTRGVDDFELELVSPPEAVQLPDPSRVARPMKVDYLRLEAANRALGEQGEEAVRRHEVRYLRSIGRDDLAQKVQRVSTEVGDGLGYDIRSYRADESEHFIEVKTTRRPKEARFYVSANELRVSQRLASNYSLYRVSNWGRPVAGLYTLSGAIDETCHLEASNYLAVPRDGGR